MTGGARGNTLVLDNEDLNDDPEVIAENEISDFLPEANSFNPADYIINIKGKGPYLETKYRLLWLRTLHPDAIIETEHVTFVDKGAIFKATVSIPGGGKATGYGSETSSDFRDFIEKAETKALGRALAALGFGIQFTGDDSELNSGNNAPQSSNKNGYSNSNSRSQYGNRR